MEILKNSALIEPAFQLLNARHCQNLLRYLKDNNRVFQITCFKQFTEFDSNDLSFVDTLNDIFLMNIENYSLETFVCLDNHIEFSTGFGESPEEVKIKIPYAFIISIEEDYKLNLYRNPSIIFSLPTEDNNSEDNVEEKLNESKNKFLNNPKNNRFSGN